MSPPSVMYFANIFLLIHTLFFSSFEQGLSQSKTVNFDEVQLNIFFSYDHAFAVMSKHSSLSHIGIEGFLLCYLQKVL